MREASCIKRQKGRDKRKKKKKRQEKRKKRKENRGNIREYFKMGFYNLYPKIKDITSITRIRSHKNGTG